MTLRSAKYSLTPKLPRMIFSSISLIHGRQRLQQAHAVARIGYFNDDIETIEVVFSKGFEVLLDIYPMGFDTFLRAIQPNGRSLGGDLSAATTDQKSLGRLIHLKHPHGWMIYLRRKWEGKRPTPAD